MNILLLAPNPPYPPNSGAKIRNFNLIKIISKYHDISVLFLVRPSEIKDVSGLEKYCTVYPLPFQTKKYGRLKSLLSRNPYETMLSCYSPKIQEQISHIINHNNFQILHVESLLMSAYVKNISTIPKVYDAHNIESDILYRTFINKFSTRSVLTFLDYLKNKKHEQDAIRSFDACISVSENDSKRLRAMGAQNLMMLPNCVDLDHFYPVERKDFSPNIVFTGLMNWYPNVDAIKSFCRDAYPVLKEKIPQIKFYAVGRNPISTLKNLEKNDIFITGEVPDVRPFISNSDVCIVPLRIGGGTRLKILEYFAMEKPVISTSIGAEGIDAIDGKHLIIEDDISKFPDRINELLNDTEYAGYIAKNGRKLAEEKYSWDQYGEKLSQLFSNIAINLT